jgi:serine/threonine protein kinase
MSSQKFGRYEIKSELGRGGMATVFHAYDPSFERDVAIKVLPAAFLHDPQFRTRFEREAKMIASLEHPAIVPVYDFGEEDGQPYIVMRYMSGGSLADQLKQGAMPLDETARIISRLAPALDAAHARSIVHRDLKPGNVLFDQYGNAFLSDFGIARLSQEGGATLTGSAIVGTPAYMSPEQVQGDKAIDGRSDIYAVGVLVYQMLTGQMPYQADTPAKVMLMHLLEPVPQITAARQDVPEGCEQLIQRAMAKDPNDRYATTNELATALENLSHLPLAIPQNAEPEDATLMATATVVAQSSAMPQPTRRSRASVSRGAGGRTPPPGGDSATILATPRQASAAQVPAAGSIPVIPEAPKKRLPVLVIAIVLIGVLVVAAIGGIYFMGKQGTGPLAMLAGSKPMIASSPPTFQPTQPLPTFTKRPEALPTTIPVVVAETPTAPETIALPTNTLPPLDTPTPTAIPAVVIGGADKIAFIKSGEIWLANLDGSDLQQLTRDGSLKTGLQWTPDGQGITYLTGKCAELVRLADQQVEQIACFNTVDSFKEFEVSPDGNRVAITLDNQLYIVPYDLELLKSADTRGDLTAMADCKDFAPFQRNLVTTVRWSADSSSIAAKLIANLGNGKRGDIVQLFRVDRCIPDPRAIDNFPPPRFGLDGYTKNPTIQNFDWDGGTLFALNSIVRNDGFGNLYIYNSEQHKAYPKVNPVEDRCCYRDASFSPDGTYLVFAYQSQLTGTDSTTQLYYVPFGSIGSQAQITPMPLPEITDPKEWPQPILRPAQ